MKPSANALHFFRQLPSVGAISSSSTKQSSLRLNLSRSGDDSDCYDCVNNDCVCQADDCVPDCVTSDCNCTTPDDC